VFGAFWQGKVPKIPDDEEHIPSDIDPAKGDFCFCYLPNQNIFHHFTPHDDEPLALMAYHEENGAQLVLGSGFMLVGHTAPSEQGCFGYLEEVCPVAVSGVPVSALTQASETIPEELAVTATEIWALEPAGTAESSAQARAVESEAEQTRLTSLTSECSHPWVSHSSPYNLFRAGPVYSVPAHLTVKAAVAILLKREGEAGISSASSIASIAGLSDLTVGQVYDQFLQDADRAQELNKILDLFYDRQRVLKNTTEIEGLKKIDASPPGGENSGSNESLSEQIAAYYVPEMSFFSQFEAKGGVAKIISVTLASLALWKSSALADSWGTWLQDLSSFSQIPLFFQLFLKHAKCKELLFKVLAGLPDSELQADGSGQAHWSQEQKEAVQTNYKILSEVFSVSGDPELREKALKGGLLPRILERLATISGEKPRTFEEEAGERADVDTNQDDLPKDSQPKAEPEKNTEKKKRKGVGYSAKQGQAFDVSAYLESAKVRNEQIKTLIDICSSFLGSTEWVASKDLVDTLVASALLPLLEQAFRNGSWLDMAKASEVYASHLGK
jgi:hypothetical protein